MAQFQYTAMDKSGTERKGVIEAESKEKVLAELKSKGFLPMKVTEQNLLSRDLNISFMTKKPKARDMSVFCHQFVSILDAGVPLISALDMLTRQTENKLLRNAIDEARRSIEKGETLADAMRRNEKIFTPLFITLVEAGEASGTLTNSFTRMAVQFERSAKIKALVRKATVYPMVIGVVATVMVVVMLTVVLPTFQGIFDQIGAELPGITKAVIGMSDALIAYWYFFAIGAAGLVVFLRYARTTVTGQRVLGLLARKLPITKDFSVKSASAAMARTLSTLFSSGIPLIESLDITAKTLRNIHFREAISAVRDDVAVGLAMSESLERCALFPPMVHQMTHIGEESGNVEQMLDKMAGYYEDETEAASAMLASMMEPAIILVMAVIVGTIVIAMIAPMGAMYAALDSA